MGRNIPMEEIIVSSHPVVSSTLFVAWIIILVGIISSLCGIWSKKTTETTNEADDKKSTRENLESTTLSSKSAREDVITNEEGSESSSMRLKPPPSATNVETVNIKNYKKSLSLKMDNTSSLQNYMSKNKKKKLTGSISMHLPSKIKGAPMKIIDAPVKIKDKASEIKHHKKKEEDSLWKKRIILGEKNRLHNEEIGTSDRKDDNQKVDEDENGTTSSNEKGESDKGKLAYTRSLSASCIDYKKSSSSSSSSSIEEYLRTHDEKEYEMFSENSDDDS